MNDIQRFISLPMWVILAVVMLRKPLGVVDTVGDYAEWMGLYRKVNGSIRWIGKNWLERWLIGKVLDWCEKERKALDELEHLQVKVVSNGTN